MARLGEALVTPAFGSSGDNRDEFSDDSRRERSLDRLLALSDGILAFAITLLALDLITPVIVGQATDASLAASLIAEFHAFSGFFVSF